MHQTKTKIEKATDTKVTLKHKKKERWWAGLTGQTILGQGELIPPITEQQTGQ